MVASLSMLFLLMGAIASYLMLVLQRDMEWPAMCICLRIHWRKDGRPGSFFHHWDCVHKTTVFQTWTTVENLPVCVHQSCVQPSLVPPTQWILEWNWFLFFQFAFLLTDSSADPLGTIDAFTMCQMVQVIYQIQFVESKGDADVFANIIPSHSASLILPSL